MVAVKIFNDSGALQRPPSTAYQRSTRMATRRRRMPSGGNNPDLALAATRNSGRPAITGWLNPARIAQGTTDRRPTSASPANYPEAFAVGSVDNSGVVQVSSSRGPSTCGESSSIYPELVAPGANITTTDLSGFYTQASGTSLSSPHVAGVLALLLNAFPGITTESQAAALTNTSVDLGVSGPDNDFGYGMLDALASYNWLAAGNRATPTPAPTATATAIPTVTPTPSPTPFIDVIFSDGFESGDLNQWTSAVTDGGRLSVSAQAALVGAQGMQALISSTRPIYVLDSSPSAEATYHARFYFAPNSISVPKNKPHDVFIGRNSSGSAIFKLQLQAASGNYQLRGVILLGNGKTTTSNWFTIGNFGHAVEIAWQAASTAKGSDGSLSLWIDGTLMQTRSGIANGGYRLEEVLLGPQNIPAGSSGSEYFDAFSSSRTTYIGP
jgi:hypothetical protein